jgi:hypothetical protein
VFEPELSFMPHVIKFDPYYQDWKVLSIHARSRYNPASQYSENLEESIFCVILGFPLAMLLRTP